MDFDDKYDWLMRCADEMEFGYINESDESTLVSFLEDNDELIRSSAVDLLGNSNHSAIMERLLLKAKKDSSFLVRAYCSASIMEIAERLNVKKPIGYSLTSLFFKETSLFVKLSWIPDIIEFLDKNDYPFLIAIIDKGLKSRNRHYRNLAIEAILSSSFLNKHYTKNDLINKYLQHEKCPYIQAKIDLLFQ